MQELFSYLVTTWHLRAKFHYFAVHTFGQRVFNKILKGFCTTNVTNLWQVSLNLFVLFFFSEYLTLNTLKWNCLLFVFIMLFNLKLTLSWYKKRTSFWVIFRLFLWLRNEQIVFILKISQRGTAVKILTPEANGPGSTLVWPYKTIFFFFSSLFFFFFFTLFLMFWVSWACPIPQKKFRFTTINYQILTHTLSLQFAEKFIVSDVCELAELHQPSSFPVPCLIPFLGVTLQF